MASSSGLSLTPTQRGELQAHLRSRNLPASVAQRMRIVLLLDEGASYGDIKEKLDTTAPTISLWKRRYREAGVVGLVSVHPGQPPKKLTPQLRAKILGRHSNRRRMALHTGHCAKWRRSWESAKT
jgi:transposase